VVVCRLAAQGLGDSRFEEVIARLDGINAAESRVQLLYPLAG